MMSQPAASSSRPDKAAPAAELGRPSTPMASTVTELVAAREAKGLSAGDIAGQLKLAPRQVVALERGDWAALPGLTFVRGALRAYGRMVGIAVDDLLATLDEGAQAELRPSTSLEAPMPSGSMLGFGSGGAGSKTAWLILGAVLLLALALFFGRDTDFSTIPSLLSGSRTAPVPARDSAPTGRSGVEPIATLQQSRPALTPAASASTVSPVPPVASPSPAAPASPPTVAPPLAAPPVSSVTAAVPGKAPSVRLQFEREAWVEIKQADGKVLLYGQQKAGSEAQLSLVTELSLLIGNADHVRVDRDGKPVDIKSLARQGVARLKLNP